MAIIGKSERPLITFLLLSFNQEIYIREAIKGAFAQTYRPLEIILSDDCSTDRTFELIQEAVAEYKGPNRVVSRQTPKNIGTFAHVMDVVKDVKGKMVVLAAGDDISKPDRVSKIVKAWQSTGAWGLHSRFDRINEDGVLLEGAQVSEGLLRPDYRLRQYFYKEDGPVDIVHGVGSAYDVRIFNYLKEYSEEFILSEDGVLSFTLNLMKKKICFLDESLVCYREHQGSLTNAKGRALELSLNDIDASEKKNIIYSISLANRTKMFLSLIKHFDKFELRNVNRENIVKDNKICNFKSKWLKSNFFERIAFLVSVRDRNTIKWIVPRLFGLCFFKKFKLFFRRLKALR